MSLQLPSSPLRDCNNIVVSLPSINTDGVSQACLDACHIFFRNHFGIVPSTDIYSVQSRVGDRAQAVAKRPSWFAKADVSTSRKFDMSRSEVSRSGGREGNDETSAGAKAVTVII